MIIFLPVLLDQKTLVDLLFIFYYLKKYINGKFYICRLVYWYKYSIVGYLTEVQSFWYDFFYCFIYKDKIIQFYFFSFFTYIFVYYYILFKKYKKQKERFELLSNIIKISILPFILMVKRTFCFM